MPFKPSTRHFGEINEPSVDPDALKKLREDLENRKPLARPVRRPVKPVTKPHEQEPAPTSTPALNSDTSVGRDYTDTSSTPSTPAAKLNSGTSGSRATQAAKPVEEPVVLPKEPLFVKVDLPDPEEQPESIEPNVSRPKISGKVAKWTGIFGMAALGVFGGAEMTNGKILPAHEQKKAKLELEANQDSLISVMDRTAATMALMLEERSIVSTKKKITVYYDAPENLFYSKLGLDKERTSEKVLEFDGKLFFNNRATGEGNIWFGKNKILVSLDNFEGSFPDNKCNIPGVPKNNCMTGLVLFDLNFADGQISSVDFSILVGDKNTSNADSSGMIGTVNAGKRSLAIPLTNMDVLARIRTLYNAYLLMERQATANKTDESEPLQKKLLDGTVVFDFVSSNGNRDSCAGFVQASDVIVTAKHCLMSSKTDSNGSLLENVMGVSKDKTDVVRYTSLWTRANGKYQYAFSGYKDLGVIVFDKPAFPRAKPLGVSEKTITENDRFIFGHVVRTDGKKYWRTEFGPVLTQRDNYDLNDPYWLKFTFGLQRGNSGGATVDSNGDVVSVLRNFCDYDEATNNGKFCGDRVTKKDVATLIAEARKKLEKLDK